jgi:hypothetical protein
VQLLQQDLVDIGQREQHCINTQSKAEVQARTAMNGLPPTYAMRFGEPVEEPVAIEHFFRVYFPTEEDMQEFRLMELTEQLDGYLESMRERDPGRYTRSAQVYINEWADQQHQFVRITPGHGEWRCADG